MKLPLLLLPLIVCTSCTQTAGMTMRNESKETLVYASGTRDVLGCAKSFRCKLLAPGGAIRVPLHSVTTRGLDLPFVLLGTTSSSSERVMVWQHKQRGAKQFDFPFNPHLLTQHWAQQDFLGRLLTRHLGNMVIVDPPHESYWKPLGGAPVKLKVTPR